MLRPRIHPQLAKLLTGKGSIWQHAPDCVRNHAFRMTPVQNLSSPAGPDAAGIAGVPIVGLVGALSPSEMDLFRIDYNHMISAIHVRRELRPVLAAKARGHRSGESTQDDAVGIDDKPIRA